MRNSAGGPGRTSTGGIGRIPVIQVSPVVEGGRWPAKAAVGEVVPVTATVFREGHDAVGATAVLVAPDGTDHSWATMTDVAPGLDHFRGFLQPDARGEWAFRVEAWSDPYATWAHDATIKIEAGIDVDLMLAEGARLFRRVLRPARRDVLIAPYRTAADSELLAATLTALEDDSRPAAARLAAATSPEVRDALARAPHREMVSASDTYPLRVSRPLALAGAWYEMFPRSEGAYRKPDGTWVSGTFATAAKRLPAIASMGFDVVYLTPVSPIGTTFRKGRNNTLAAEPGDPGSPYAIGSPDGGHDAIHPELGTEQDFVAFVRAARDTGLEVALDIALQCSPDHPWVAEHAEWFVVRADGSIAYAENPPKKYQDIYPLSFDTDPEGLRAAVLDVIRTWIDRGVTLFRVDNPHTKPLDFWEWLLAEVHATNPEVIFLSEAFTRPAMMQTLARIGFHQSYTYFTWRNTKEEIEEYLAEVSGPLGSVMRPNFWPTTHDILTPYVQHGGVAGHAVRAVLAATGSPSWGMYSGYELVENTPRPGVEEHIDNEKYEYRPREWERATEYGIAALVTRLNTLRREHPALRQLRNLTVHPTTNDQVVAFSRRIGAEFLSDARSGSKGSTMVPGGSTVDRRGADVGAATVTTPAHDDVIVVVVNLDPWNSQESLVHLDLKALGLTPPEGDPDAAFYVAHDLLSNETYGWGATPYVRLDPAHRVAHVLHVTPAGTDRGGTGGIS
ncbi:alpha-1,4-glucan--maltose-1-phosphate maltosyltransferase [Myceligenerans salitolerans]|uniref:Alpha-1,4-glucan:maltose-1-phosphate maltosyltransferase n=1 Tax=Myceligenerans salitolerans TaxID=1230528 RepID=A0ABS3I624_9MICO|nr:alpha-1,4-glucan--maltose-1-phosphate maltosyltransferase [Myceligenerans salitolerans]